MTRSRPGSTIRNRHGVALPVALLSLVAVTLLVTGVLLTSSTEAVVSVAHRDAVAELHAAEGAIAAWIAEREASLQPEDVSNWMPPGGSVPVRLRVERLSRSLPGVGFGEHALYAIHAEPAHRAGQGRGVVALIRKREVELPHFDPALDAALTLGGDSRLTGNGSGEHLVHDGEDHPFCASEERRALAPVLLAHDAALALTGGAQLQGSPSWSHLDRSGLAAATFSGISIRDLGWSAAIRFGSYFNERPFPGGTAVHSGNADARFNWGCPSELVSAIRDAAPGSGEPPPCHAPTDTSRYVAVAIDGENRAVTLANQHGQGVLVVVNGDLHITGDFVWKGIVLAERRILLSGAAPGWPPSIDGALYAAEGVVIDGALTPNGLGGTNGLRAVRFDRCAVQRSLQALTGAGGDNWGAPDILGKPHGWFEAVQ